MALRAVEVRSLKNLPAEDVEVIFLAVKGNYNGEIDYMHSDSETVLKQSKSSWTNGGFITEEVQKVEDQNNLLLKEYYSGNYYDFESIPHFMSRRKHEISIERTTADIENGVNHPQAKGSWVSLNQIYEEYFM